jgi:hypothetical protein
MRDNAWDWFVMPRIRIDSIYAAGTAHNEDTVCRIIITGWKGDIVKDIWLFIKNFKQSYQGIYNGNYLDTFHLYGSQDSLYIDTATINSYFLPPNNGNPFDWGNTCKMDIKIYWAGKVDTWFDRVRIENLPAHQYLTLQDSSIIIKIDTEIYWANNTIAGQIPNYFYFGECQFSHFPAIKELNKRIMTHSQNQNGITVDFNYPLFRAHIPGFPDSYQSNLTVEQLKKYLCEDDSLQRINMYSYPLGGWEYPHDGYSYHPSTLYSGDYLPTHGILSTRTDPNTYEDWLQSNLDEGEYISINKKIDSLSKRTNMRIIFVPQAHLWYTET